MTRRFVFLVSAIVMLPACAGDDPASSAPPVDLPAATDSPSTGPTAPPAGTTVAGGELYPGFEFDRVAQISPEDLPDGTPVPVPAGGEIDGSMTASEGELLFVTYSGPFFPTAVAFYGTWIHMEQLEASPLFGSGDEVAGWEFSVDGVPVRIEIMNGSGGNSAILNIFWG